MCHPSQLQILCPYRSKSKCKNLAARPSHINISLLFSCAAHLSVKPEIPQLDGALHISKVRFLPSIQDTTFSSDHPNSKRDKNSTFRGPFSRWEFIMFHCGWRLSGCLFSLLLYCRLPALPLVRAKVQSKASYWCGRRECPPRPRAHGYFFPF